jgi:hypothetical protein
MKTITVDLRGFFTCMYRHLGTLSERKIGVGWELQVVGLGAVSALERLGVVVTGVGHISDISRVLIGNIILDGLKTTVGKLEKKVIEGHLDLNRQKKLSLTHLDVVLSVGGVTVTGLVLAKLDIVAIGVLGIDSISVLVLGGSRLICGFMIGLWVPGLGVIGRLGVIGGSRVDGLGVIGRLRVIGGLCVDGFRVIGRLWVIGGCHVDGLRVIGGCRVDGLGVIGGLWVIGGLGVISGCRVDGLGVIGGRRVDGLKVIGGFGMVNRLLVNGLSVIDRFRMVNRLLVNGLSVIDRFRMVNLLLVNGLSVIGWFRMVNRFLVNWLSVIVNTKWMVNRLLVNGLRMVHRLIVVNLVYYMRFSVRSTVRGTMRGTVGGTMWVFVGGTMGCTMGCTMWDSVGGTVGATVGSTMGSTMWGTRTVISGDAGHDGQKSEYSLKNKHSLEAPNSEIVGKGSQTMNLCQLPVALPSCLSVCLTCSCDQLMLHSDLSRRFIPKCLLLHLIAFVVVGNIPSVDGVARAGPAGYAWLLH